MPRERTRRVDWWQLVPLLAVWGVLLGGIAFVLWLDVHKGKLTVWELAALSMVGLGVGLVGQLRGWWRESTDDGRSAKVARRILPWMAALVMWLGHSHRGVLDRLLAVFFGWMVPVFIFATLRKLGFEGVSRASDSDGTK